MAYKILTAIIHNRLIKYSDKIIGNYQCGFRRGRSTIDALHIVKQIVEKSYEYDIDMHLLFIDFRQAFDKVDRYELVRTMKEWKIPSKIIRLIRMTLEQTSASVRTTEGETENFNINSGVRQGDALSASLFNIALERIIQRTNCRGTIRNKETQLVAYADDVVLISRSEESMAEVLQNIEEAAKEMRLIINCEKTKYMKCERTSNDTRKEIKINKHVFEKVENFNYLGVQINCRSNRDSEIKARVQAGNRAYYANKAILSDKGITKTTKKKIYKTLIRPVLTYASEVMCITQREEEVMRCFERKILRTILGPKEENDGFRPRMNFEIRNEMEGEDIVKFMKAQRVKWLGHIMRRDDEEPTKLLTMWKPDGKRYRGRPRLRWWNCVMEDLEKMGINDWKQQIMDRMRWRKVINEAKTHRNI